MPVEGMKLWVTTLIEYDKFGNAKVITSFSKPAADSTIKMGKKVVKKVKSETPEVSSEEQLW